MLGHLGFNFCNSGAINNILNLSCYVTKVWYGSSSLLKTSMINQKTVGIIPKYWWSFVKKTAGFCIYQNSQGWILPFLSNLLHSCLVITKSFQSHSIRHSNEFNTRHHIQKLRFTEQSTHLADFFETVSVQLACCF